MDFVGPFVGVIDTYLIAPLGRQINYLKSSNNNVNDLQDVVRKLKARRDDEETTLKAAENTGQEKTAVAHDWFESVDGIDKDAQVIETKYNQGRCAGGWCVNYWSRYKLSKSSLSLKQKAIDRLSEQFVVAKPPSLKSVIEMPTEPFQNQTSTQRMLQKMLDCIGDPEIGIFGVYGMGGVGKTTLAKEVNNHFKNDSCFESVIMVTVSATPKIPSIQNSIGKRIGLPDNGRTGDALFEALSKKKFLIILDDVWRKIKLEDVGIPHPAQNNKGSKILVTSRNQDTCTDMGASQTIKVQPLSEAESWELFVKVAGKHVVANDIKRFAEKIVERCQGLPLAIVTVGRAMANRHGVGVWKNASREMKQSAKDLRGMIDEVLVPLKFSFDRLENDMLRSLFLYCACFPEDYDIRVEDEMLNYCVGEGLIDRLGSLKAARDKCEDLIESLKISCMLEDGGSEGSVRVHDMMQELALWITSSESDSSPKFLIRNGESVKEAPKAHEWVDATKISLINTQIEELPELGESCPKLNTLLYRYTFLHAEVIHNLIPPTNFFQHMDHLSVLDLSNTDLEYLPDSLSCLVNLLVLRLQWCRKLRALPKLGMLRQLQFLDLSWCGKLDQEILGSECVEGVSSNLRYLNVEYSEVSIPVGVISRLHKLEELGLYKAEKIKWKMSAAVSSSSSSSSSSINMIHDVGEFSSLTSLTSLSIFFEDVIISDWFKPLAKTMTYLRLRRCRVIKQDALQALNESPNLRNLRFQDCLGVTWVPTRVAGDVEIDNCEDLEVLLDGTEEDVYQQDSFKVLWLTRLPKLKRICVSLAPLNCFAQLQTLGLWGCNSLKMVFSKGMPRLFNNLEVISITECERMEVIIEGEEEEGELVLEEGRRKSNVNGGGVIIISPFPRLRDLNLTDLPLLAELYSNHILDCPLIKEVRVRDCPRLKQNPLQLRNAEGLIVPSLTGEIEVMEEEIQASL
ncbi:disease resistance protein RPS2-like [Macadamia integrifolia]|uniref:disease resistance protein RPS2-like n=1 Tax=Macadamia integrifolia TaxID=60698 RepID=UPI001C4EAC35|nr:disease resistance protein RPS2-like [Macadamia integrifolia]